MYKYTLYAFDNKIYTVYSRENCDLNQTFEKQIIQFKRTWVGYHNSKIL